MMKNLAGMDVSICAFLVIFLDKFDFGRMCDRCGIDVKCSDGTSV